MKDKERESRIVAVIQGVLGAGLVAAGLRWMLQASGARDSGGLLLAYAVVITGAVFLAPLIAQKAASPVARLLYAGERRRKPEAGLSVPQAHRKFRRHDKALEALEEVVAEAPDCLEAWVEMVDIAVTELHDHDRARGYVRRGRLALPSADAREALSRAFQVLSERARAAETTTSSDQPRVLEFPDDMA